MKIALVIASRGRAELLAQILPRWEAQSRSLDHVVLSVSSVDDLPDEAATLPLDVEIGSPGLCAQRNRALDHLSSLNPDVVVFADDDFIPPRNFIAGVDRVFSQNQNVAVATGWVLADGARGDAVSLESAERLLHEYDAMWPVEPALRKTTGGYGCNMAVRFSEAPSLRFDERLALYGWQEDIDFTRRFRNRGRIVSTRAFGGVHLGYQTGRVRGNRLGFSQIINPTYLVLKGTMPAGFGLKLVLCNLLANAKGAIFGDPLVDRSGRLHGNLLGLLHLITGRVRPENVVKL